MSAAGCFLPGREVLFLAGVIGFGSLEYVGGCSARVGFERDFRRVDFFGVCKSVFSCGFLGRPLRLGGCVLGVGARMVDRAGFWFGPLKSECLVLRIFSDIF